MSSCATRFRNIICLLAAIGGLLLAGAPVRAAEYTIQSDDVLAIRVDGEPGLTQNYTVDEMGNISIGQAGKVHVAGMSAKQAQQKVTQELGKYLKIFDVSVFVVGETGSRVLVYGEVAKPGMVKIREGAKLLDVLAEAGQPTIHADTKRISVMRKDGAKPEVVDLEDVLKNPALNLPINVGDSITIPSKVNQTVRVLGDVRIAGPVPMEDVKTVYAAVQHAAPKETADWTRVILRRKNSEVPLVVDLSRVRTGQLKDDMKLEEGDEITVSSKFTGTATVRGEISAPGEKDLNGPTQLWDFILRQAGGFTEKADRRRVQVIRDGKVVQTVNLVAVSTGSHRSDDPTQLVEPNDVIFVPTGTAILRGEVKQPGEKVLGNTTQLWDFLLNAGGGFTEHADQTRVQIIRDGKPVRTVDLTAVASGVKSADDPELEVQPGDAIFVPNDDRNRFVIVGGVRKPGSYPLKPGTTLLDALAQAEGFSDRANRKQIVIAPGDRFDAQGKLKEMATASHSTGSGKSKSKDKPEDYGLTVVDIKKLQKGDASQFVALHPGDRIFVAENPPADPNARHKPSFLQSVMQLIPLASVFMGGYGYGGGYYPYGGY